jgi:pimeloyl-ACP methyl ester carboxylesterase
VTAVLHSVDVGSRSFVAQVPRSLLEPAGRWTVRLAAGLANAAGDGFADVPAEHGALPGQPNVYNVAFRTNEQEPPHLNFWSDKAQAKALSSGDVSEFAVVVDWDALAERETTPEPVLTGASTRWYVSSVELGQGIKQGLAADNILSTEPQFLGRVQPYSICLPSTYAPGRALPVTLLLHSLSLGQTQFAAIDPRLLHEVCETRESVVITPLARGPSTWYFDTGELDVWEVWARVAEQLGTDPNRTVVSGYSMGGYAAYKLGLTYPEVFAQAVVLAGPPACGVRPLPDVDIPADLNPDSPCAREGDSWKLLVNARWLPYVIAHGLVDELVPFASAAEQVLELDRLGYHRFTVYPLEDHIAWIFQDKFDDPIAHMGTGLRQADPGHITFAWYPQLVRADLGIGPHQVWWLSELTAAPELVARRGAVAEVDARSYARPDPTHTITHQRGIVGHFDPTPGLYSELDWLVGPPVGPLPYLTLRLNGVGSLTVDVERAGLAALPSSTISVATETATQITLGGLGAGVVVQVDGQPAGPSVALLPGRHRIELIGKTVRP